MLIKKSKRISCLAKVQEEMKYFEKENEKIVSLLNDTVNNFETISDKTLTILEAINERINFIVEINNLLDKPKNDN